MIPSWTVLQDADAKAAESHLANPIAFYRVQVGIQSPHGVSTLRKVLRRFSDFLKLHAAIKRAFPKKHVPVAPPKNSMMWMNASQTHLQERRHALVDWLGKLLADIDISRSAPVAAFLELEAAARAAMNVVKEAQLSTTADLGSKPVVSSSGRTSSVNSGTGYVSDSTHEVPGITTLKKTSDEGSEMEMEGLILEHQTDGSTEMSHEVYDSSEHLDDSLSVQELSPTVDPDVVVASDDTAKQLQLLHSSREAIRIWHGRRPSSDSIASEVSSARGSELSFLPGGEGSVEGLPWEHTNNSNQSSGTLSAFDTESLKGIQASLPIDQRRNVVRVLTNLQRRLGTAKADMEDLIARLNQETAVKDFLATKVRDLEGELDGTRRKSRETLLRVVSMERDNFNNLQWELEEARAALISANEKVQLEQEARIQTEERLQAFEREKQKENLEVAELRKELQSFWKDRESTEAKTKAEMKVLAREIKALRKSQPELKEELEMALKEKTELETIIQKEREQQERNRIARANFLREVATLRQRLHECSMEFLAKQDDKSILKNAAITDAIDLLATSDNRIGLLAAEAQLLTEEKEEDETLSPFDKKDLPNGLSESGSTPRVHTVFDQDMGTEKAFRKMLAEIFMDNAQLYKVVNSMTLNAVVMDSKQEKAGLEEAPTRKSVSVLNRFL